MRKARIENGVVVDIVDIYSIHEDFAHLYSVECGGNVQIGSLYKNGEFAPPPIASLEVFVLGSSSGVPYSVTPRQARLALLSIPAPTEENPQKTLLEDVEALLASNRTWQITWEYANEIERNSPLILELATALGLSEEQIDELFIRAKGL